MIIQKENSREIGSASLVDLLIINTNHVLNVFRKSECRTKSVMLEVKLD